VGVALKKSPNFIFHRKGKQIFYFLGLEGKKFYQEPPKVPSIFIF